MLIFPPISLLDKLGNETPPPVTEYLLLEDGSFILLESGDKIELE